MAVQELNPLAANAQVLRAELDELLRARQYAVQRERRLSAAVEAANAPDRAHGYTLPQQYPDPELLRQLTQAQHLREGLGTRCLELSERLLALEDQLRRPSAQGGPATSATPTTVTTAPAPAAGQAAAPVAAPKRPIGARFSGAYQETAAPQLPSLPVIETPPMTGARFGGPKPAAAQPATAQPTPTPEPVPNSSRPAGPATTPAPQPRTSAEIDALAERIAAFHQRGDAHESAAIVAQAAVILSPTDVARLASLLRASGPVGAAGYLARAVVHGSADQAADTLAELRRTGLTEEAAELFHALWGYPATSLPALLAALERSGQSTDGLTLLWEWGAAPPAELASLAGLLRDSGRPGDARGLLHQSAGRPVDEVAETVLELDGPLATTLIREVAKVRSATDLARFGAALAGWSAPYEALLTAIADLSESRARSALAELRSTGLPTTPATPATRQRGRR